MITPSTLATYAAEGYESEYRLEVDQRLDQMEFMLGRVKGLLIRSSASDFAADLQYNAYLDRAPHLREAAYQEEIRGYKVQLQKSMPFYMNQVEIKVLTEAFYYCASRTRQVLRRFPGLGHFEAKGIRDVRNHLLEHPEGDSSGVIENGVSCGDDCGPVLRGVRRSDKVDIFPDRGLYLNAEEFASNLHGSPNFLEPGKRPFCTLNPGIALKSGKPHAVYGTQGADGQPQTLAVVLTRLLDYGMDPLKALSGPRFLLGRTFSDVRDCLKLERAAGAATFGELARRNHEVTPIATNSPLGGQAGAIVIHDDGSMEGAHDPRSDGMALGL